MTEFKTNSEIKKELSVKKKELLKSIPNIIAFAIVFLVTLMTFADFKFTKILSWGFAAGSSAFVLLSFLMYYVNKITGKRAGRQNQEYLQNKKNIEEKISQLMKDGSENDLPDFCTHWIEWELEKARKRSLTGSGISYEKWLEFAPLGDNAIAATCPISKIEKMKTTGKITESEYILILKLKSLPWEIRGASIITCLVKKKNLTPQDIIVESSEKDGRDPVPKRLSDIDRRQDIISLVPLITMMTITLLIVPEIAGVGINLKSIIYGLMRIISIMVTGFRGNYNGETLYTVDAIENMKIQDNLLNLFFNWRANKRENM